MDILVMLKEEQSRLERQLKGIRRAILALNGSHTVSSRAAIERSRVMPRKRRMSAAARARISKTTKERWAKFRAEKSKSGK